MLVVSRAAGESVMIGQDVEVSVAAIGASSVTLDVRHTTLAGRITLDDSFRRELTRDGVLALPVVGGTCELVDLRPDKVRLGLSDIPPAVSVHRREIYEAILRKNRRDRG